MIAEATKEIEALMIQYREMMNAVADLRKFLQRPRPEVGVDESHGWATSMAEKLTRLHDQVSRHFRAEERSELLEEHSHRRPHATRKIEILRRDHDRILGDLRTILGATMIYAEGRRPANPQLRRWTLSVLDRLSQHEHEETELFQRLLYQDTGSAG